MTEWPPFDRHYLVEALRRGREMAEDWVDARGQKCTRRWHEPDRSLREHYATSEEAAARMEVLLREDWDRVHLVTP